MAFGGRELRLILSIQSYGTSNLSRLRRDIIALDKTAKAANMNQLAVQKQAVQAAGQAATIQKRISGLQRQQLAAQGIGPLKQRLKLTKTLNAMGYRGAVLEDLMTGKSKARSAAANAMVSTLRAQDAQLRMIAKSLQIEELELRKILATQELLNGAVMAEARARDANLARLAALEGVEARARQVAHIGRAAQFTGLITVAALGAASNAFADFSAKASLASTQMRDIGGDIEQATMRSKELQDVILELGMRFPASASDMADSAYQIFSSMNIVKDGVVDVAAGLQILERANEAAVAGQVDLEEATKAMIVVLNNFDPELKNVIPLLNQMFTVVRYGNMRLNDLGTAMNSLAPVAKTMGIEFQDVGAALATLTILTPNLETASTGLARTLELLRLPAFVDGLKAWGVEIEDVHGKLLPLDQVIGKLTKRFPEMTTGQKAAVEVLLQISKASGLTKAGIQGTVQARRALALLVTGYDLYKNILGNVTSNQTEFNEALAKQMADPGVQWQIFLRQMQTLVLLIGREAIPVFLRLGDMLGDFVEWFRNLNPRVRTTIVQFTAFAGIAALLFGTLLSVVGSMYALRANMAIMTLTTGQTATKMLFLRGVLGSIVLFSLATLITQMYDLQTAIIVTTGAWILWKTGAIQAIAAVVKAVVIGAATIKMAIRAALVGTGWGALIVASGLAAEYVMNHWDQVRAFFQALAASIAVIWENLWELVKVNAKLAAQQTVGFFEELQTGFGLFGELPSPGVLPEFGTKEQIDKARADVDRLHGEIGKAFWTTYNKAMDAYQKARTAKTKKDEESFMTEYQKLVQQLVSSDFLKAQQDFIDGLNPDTNGLSDAASLAKKREQEIAQAMEDMEQKIGTAVDNLASIYDRFEQENERAFGSLFQGPVLSGLFGDVFNEINDQLRQFGVQIPIPFQILQQDMDAQLTYFARWRDGIDKLISRGVPLEMIDQIRAMGPEAIPMIEGLLGASPSQFKGYVADFKKGQTLIQQAAKTDMDRQLREWRSHGKNIAWEIINGLASSPAQAKLRAGFKKYVIATFGDILRVEMSVQVEKAMAQALKEAAASNAAKKAAENTGKVTPPTPPELDDIHRKDKDEGKPMPGPGQPGSREPGSRDAPGTHSVGVPQTIIEGDTVTIHADGATPAAVNRALNKQKFKQRSRQRAQRGQRR